MEYYVLEIKRRTGGGRTTEKCMKKKRRDNKDKWKLDT
jgi:hypothetical protein